MRYWWVNQNRTYRHEVPGGYLWSPKRKSNGQTNPFYEFMREVAPGDLVFSFADTRIRAVGIATSFAYEAAQPTEFGDAGRNWERIGWRVDVAFQELATSFRPVDWIEHLRPLMPKRYAPLQSDGRGVQSIYLTELPASFAHSLADLAGAEFGAIARSEAIGERPLVPTSPETVMWEEHLRHAIETDTTIPDTEKQALVLARRGQGLFRERVRAIERCCRVTRVERIEHLRASHCKPWRDSDNSERLDAENGLLLTPSIDHLFDRGFISFGGEGRLLVSPVAHRESLAKMGVAIDRKIDVGEFTPGQRRFLEYHRELVFLQARVGA